MERKRPSRTRLVLFLGFPLLVLSAFVMRASWLPVLGHALVHDDGPAKADIAVVLGGDYYGKRILKAGELVREGYAPAALVSGPPGFYGLHESDVAIPFAVRQGYPVQWFIPFPNNSLSTTEEATVVLAELRRRGVRSFLLVTSDFHSARARRAYLAAERAAGGGPAMRVVAAPDEFFRAGSWWRSRQAQKTVFFEWSKTLAAAVGM